MKDLDKRIAEFTTGYYAALADVQNYLNTIDTEYLSAEELRLLVHKYVRYIAPTTSIFDSLEITCK